MRGRIEAVLDFARVQGWRQDDGRINPAAWKGNLALTLPAKTRVHAVKHRAALDWRDLPAFMAQLGGQDRISARALQFAILTAARSAGVRGATWAEIDGAALTLPQSRMKAGPQHRLPRSEPALAILRVIANMQHEPGSLIFPGMTQRMPLSAMSLTAVLRRMGRGDLTAHGSRSTFHDWAVEATASRIMFSSKRWHMRSALQWRPPIAAAICSPSGLS